MSRHGARLLSAALALILALGLCACAAKPEAGQADLPVREDVSTYGGGENLAPDGTPFETVYVPGIMDFDRSFSLYSKFATSPNGLYVYDELAERLYEFDAEGRCLREWTASVDEYDALLRSGGSEWQIKMHENKEDPFNQSIDYRVLHIRDGQEMEVMSFRDEQGTTGLVGLDEAGFLLYHVWWDERGEGHFVLESYNSAAELLHSQELGEWMEIHRAESGVYLLGRDSCDVFLYDPESFVLNKVDSVPEDCRSCGLVGDTLYLTDSALLYRHKLGSGENEPLFRYDTLYLSGTLVPVPIGGTDRFFFQDYSSQVSPYRVAYPVDKNSLPAKKSVVTLAISEEIPEFISLPYGSYSEQIRDFNTVSREYEIVVRNYADCPDPFLALSADIAGGNAPDLIDVRGFGSAVCSVSTAEDLLPYIERELGADALLPGPLAAMKTDGKLLSLMPSFSLTAILGPASLLDGQDIDSFADLSSLAGGTERVFYHSVDRESFLKWVFANDQRDYSAGQVADYLAFAAALPEEAVQNPYAMTEAELQAATAQGDKFPLDYGPVHEELQKLELARIESPSGGGIGILSSDACVLPEAAGWFGEPLAAVGLPGAAGSGVYLSPTQELMLPLAAQNKEGAWAFLAFVLNDRYLTNPLTGGFRYGIPLTRSAFDRGISREWDRMDGTAVGLLSGVNYDLRYDPENCKALFLDLLERADGVCRDGDEIFDAVMNIANAYFSGDKPLGQAADDIARRLKIYHAEQG